MKGDYRVAVIGCGNRGKAHINAYKHIDVANVVATCDVIKDKADERANEFGITAYYDAEEMVQKEKPDLVHITTTATQRVNLLTLVSESGVPGCTVEKPLAISVNDWRDLQEIEKKGGCKIAVSHQFRWHEDFVKCQKALKGEKLGKMLFLDITSGMNISGQGTHVLNYGFSLNDESPVVEVFGTASGTEEMNSVHPGPDTTVGYLKYQNGARALWTSGHISPKTGDPSTTYQHVRLAAYAEKGRVLWEEFGNWEIVSPDGNESGNFGGKDNWMESNLRAQAAFHNAMFEWIEDDDKIPGTNFHQSLHEWEVILALYASTLERKPIKLEEFDPSTDLLDDLKNVLT